jgi:hypothetical protein
MAQNMDLPTSAAVNPRLSLRTQARRLLGHPQDAQAHLARVDAALQIEGTEAVQGALADMFAQLDKSHAGVKRIAYQACQHRLCARISLAFEGLIEQNQIPLINKLATRWSLLSIPGADIPTRVRRCSLDASRALAAAGLHAFETHDETAQHAFLEHCMTCHDKMAFMLARRSVLKIVPRLPDAWESVSSRLEAL